MPTRARRSFTREYKTEAVRAAERSGNVAQTARDLGITPNALYRWKRELSSDGHRAFPGNGSPRDEELTQLRRENKRLQDELSIVKKALGIVSSPSLGIVSSPSLGIVSSPSLGIVSSPSLGIVSSPSR